MNIDLKPQIEIDDEIRIRKEWKALESKYAKKLTPGQVIEAFPLEAKYMVKRELKRIIADLEPFIAFLRRLKHGNYTEDVKMFYTLVCKEIFMPRKKVEHMTNLKIMERIMCRTTRGITEEEIARAKEVNIWGLFDFKKRRGSTACCPFHQDDTPSFQVRGKRFVCYGCGKRGDSIDFVMEMNNMPFYKAVRYLNGSG